MSNEQTEILRKAQAELEVALAARVRQFEERTGLKVVSFDVWRNPPTIGARSLGEVIGVKAEVQL